MKKFKKIVAVLMSVAMIVCMFAVPASAASVFDGAKKISALELVSGDHKTKAEHYYKIVLSDKGKIKFHCAEYAEGIAGYTDYLYLLDSNGNTIIDNYSDGIADMVEKEYDISKKGTYYIKIKQRTSDYWYKDFYYTFIPVNSPSISIAITMKVGEKIDFSTVTSNYNGNVTWKTTKSSVATVSKGTVTAKKKGKAQIRAYMNNGDYAEITVKVKK